MSEHCQFQNVLNDALRDRFVCGLSSVAIQRKLLSEAYLTLKKASDFALSMEMAEKEAKKVRSQRKLTRSPSSVSDVVNLIIRLSRVSIRKVYVINAKRWDI